MNKLRGKANLAQQTLNFPRKIRSARMHNGPVAAIGGAQGRVQPAARGWSADYGTRCRARAVTIGSATR